MNLTEGVFMAGCAVFAGVMVVSMSGQLIEHTQEIPIYDAMQGVKEEVPKGIKQGIEEWVVANPGKAGEDIELGELFVEDDYQTVVNVSADILTEDNIDLTFSWDSGNDGQSAKEYVLSLNETT